MNVDNISRRINYYLGDIKDKKWNILFDKETEIYRDIDTEKEYEDINKIACSTYLVDKDLNREICKRLYFQKEAVKTFKNSQIIFGYEFNGYINPSIELLNSDPYFKEK